MGTLTILSEFHATKCQCAHPLLLQVVFMVDENSGKVLVRVIWDASRRDALQELGLGEFACQLSQVIVHQSAHRDAVREIKSERISPG